MKSNKRKHENLEVLNQVIEHSHPLRILTSLHIDKGSNLGRLERDVRICEFDLEFLLADDGFSGPELVVLPVQGSVGSASGDEVLLDNLGGLDDSLQFCHGQRTDVHCRLISVVTGPGSRHVLSLRMSESFR